MSVITDIAIIAHDTEHDAIAAVNAVLPLPLDGPAKLNGGDKVGSFAAWGGAYNFLEWEDVCEAIKAAPWRFPDWVTIVRFYEFRDNPERLSIADLP